MALQFKSDIITDFLQWMQELGCYIYLHLILSGYQKLQVHSGSKLQVIRCYLRDMPLLKTINKSHLIIQAEKFLDIKHVWFIVLELEQPFHLAASKEAS